MGIQIENGKYRGRATDATGRRISRMFSTREDAERWVAASKQEAALIKEAVRATSGPADSNGRRNRSALVDSSLLACVNAPDTVGAVLQKAIELDWADKPEQQERGIRACRMLGFDTPIASVTTNVLDEIVASLKQEGVKNGTIKIYLSAINVVLKRGKRLRVVYEMPLMPEGRTLPLPEPVDLVIQDDWYQHFLSCHTRPQCRLLTEFLWHIGCRVSEAQRLPWERINVSSGRIHFIKTKTSKPRALPISDEVQSILMQSKKLRSQSTPFLQAYRNYYNYYVECVKNTCQYFGLGPYVEKKWRIHTLRHTKLTRLANQGANAVQIQYWAGHLHLSTSQGYIHGSGVDLECLINLEGSQATQNSAIPGQLY
jgi:integrase